MEIKKLTKLFLMSSFVISTSIIPKPAFSEGFEDLLNNVTGGNNSNIKVDPNKNLTMPPMFPEYKAASEPKVQKTSIVLSGGKNLVFWKNKKDKDPQYNTWTWYPRIKFDIRGPISAGSQVYVEFLKPNGSVWKVLDCDTQELQPDYTRNFSTADFDEKESIKDTGNFKFNIKIKNELEGTNKTLYSGTYKVTKFHVGNNLPDFKNQFEFVIDQDWHMPIGYLILKRDGDERGLFSFATWFKGNDESSNGHGGYLYYNGKLVANTKDAPAGKYKGFSGGSSYATRSIYTPGGEKEPQWHLMKFSFTYAILYGMGQNSDYEDFHNLSKKPGEYEIKILRNGKLARVAKFKVEEPGRIVNNYGEWTSQSEYWIPIPVKLITDQDQKFDPNAWKTNMYFGNTIKGILD
ncbi:MAG: hypothetical protein U0457_11320 [Candidatus Sericytochromatia bacterium]